MSLDKLLTPLQIGDTQLANRIVMAPMTRSRAGEGLAPTTLTAAYYAQRANAGLIITEATQISQQGQGYAQTPGIYTDAQQAAWANVVSQVHAAGGKIALQLWHVGRISHHSLQADGAAPVAPSAIKAKGARTFLIENGKGSAPETDEPRALGIEELPSIVQQYADSAARAIAAGFDLVEIHAANGYLLNQFLATNSNQRTDSFGGSIENRARLVLEVVDAIVARIGASKTGIRLSPFGSFNDMADTETVAMYRYLLPALSQRQIAFLHINEPDWSSVHDIGEQAFREQIRNDFKGILITCGGYDAARGDAMLAQGFADAIAYGRPYIANPDLVARYRAGTPLNETNQATVYGGGAEGYTDYPALP